MSLDLSSDVIEHAYQSLLHPSQKDQDVEDAIHDFILLEYDPNPKASQKDGQNSNGTAAFRSSLSSQQSLRLAKLGSNGIDQLRPMFKPGEILFALIRIQRKILIIQYFSEEIRLVLREPERRQKGTQSMVGKHDCNRFKTCAARIRSLISIHRFSTL